MIRKHMFLDLFFPNRCLHCNMIIDANLLTCTLCFEKIQFTHFDYFEENTLKEICKTLFPIENAYALLQFEKKSVSQKIIHELKYKGREKTGKILAHWITERIDFKNGKPDLIVSIPLHKKKQKERGYNQLHLFAETLSEFYNIPFDHEIITKVHYSKAQALQDKKHRLKTENLFSINKNISGKHILLIDDVFTTGNTMATVVWQILTKGNNKISILVMAMDK